jgi:Rieske Fe-S protein
MPEPQQAATTENHRPPQPTADRSPVGFGAVPRRIALGGGLAAVAGLAVACTVGGGRADSGGSSGDGQQASGGSDGTPGTIVAVDSIPVGEAVAVTIAGEPAVVARPDANTVTAFSRICTHMGCTVDVDKAMLRCPCHGSQYDALTGAVTHGPAERNLPEIAVTVSGGDVVQA